MEKMNELEKENKKLLNEEIDGEIKFYNKLIKILKKLKKK